MFSFFSSFFVCMFGYHEHYIMLQSEIAPIQNLLYRFKSVLLYSLTKKSEYVHSLRSEF